MYNLVLLILIVGLHVYWIYKLVTYDWNQFEQDSKDDEFLNFDNIQR